MNDRPKFHQPLSYPAMVWRMVMFVLLMLVIVAPLAVEWVRTAVWVVA
jgi:hypothetical protein